MPKNSKARNVRLKHRKSLAKLKARESALRSAPEISAPVLAPPIRPARPRRTTTGAAPSA